MFLLLQTSYKENMSNKYELVKNDSIEVRDHTLYRIKALKDFNNVKKGDLGGYIEKPYNLDQKDNCWVYDNAKVYQNAKIYGNATAHDDAEISGNALIYDEAIISGFAKVYEHARVFGTSFVTDNAQIFKEETICNVIICDDYSTRHQAQYIRDKYYVYSDTQNDYKNINVLLLYRPNLNISLCSLYDLKLLKECLIEYGALLDKAKKNSYVLNIRNVVGSRLEKKFKNIGIDMSLENKNSINNLNEIIEEKIEETIKEEQEKEESENRKFSKKVKTVTTILGAAETFFIVGKLKKNKKAVKRVGPVKGIVHECCHQGLGWQQYF